METSALSPSTLQSVLVATDFSAASATATLYGISIARHYGATLYLANMVRPSTLGYTGDSLADAWRQGQRLETDLLIAGHLRGVPHKLIVEQAEVWEGLSGLIERYGIGMLVVGTRGRTGLAKVLFGSVAERIFRQALCPVLSVGPGSPPPTEHEQGLQRILYATDFTPQSLHAAAHALSLAERYQSELALLHVLPEEDAGEWRREQARSRLREIFAATSLKQEPRVEVRTGNPAEAILEFAQTMNAQLIALGVTQPGDTAFTGRRWSVASEVAGRAPCPVLTVRQSSAG
jgi:nucleotide-binding universal stress UspA family protein